MKTQAAASRMERAQLNGAQEFSADLAGLSSFLRSDFLPRSAAF
jgi:hypothetical protein